MILSDRITGPLLALGGAAVIAASTRLSAVPGVRFGADRMPTIIGILLVICGVIIAVGGFRRPVPLLDLSEWEVPPRSVLAALWSTLGVIVAIALFRWAGFPLLALVYALGLMLLMGARPMTAILASLGTMLVLFYGFSEILHVPLPTGLLTAVLP